MDSKALAEMVLSSTHKANPNDYSRHVGENDKGINYVLHFLYKSEGPVTSGDIAKNAPFSTARLAALLNKMEERGLVTRKDSKEDARKTYVALTEEGKMLHDKNHEMIVNCLAKVIDKMGVEDFEELQRLVHKWFVAMQEVMKECEE
ncbi:MAG: winged helix DNA-binding protein [Bacilli bacterium]|nr:winged helix DNA-binding protein [Bacilli bacterium]